MINSRLLKQVVVPRLSRGLETNALSSTNPAEKTLQKFWTSVTVEPIDSPTRTGSAVLPPGYAVALDKKPIKTSLSLPLIVKNVSVAHLLAQEWSVIASSKIRTHALPLTSLAARAVDLEYGEERLEEKEKIYKHLMPYLDTDTLLIFSPTKDCDGSLRAAQEEQYWPVIEEAQAFWDVELSVLDSDKQMYGNHQSDLAKARVQDWMRSLNSWKLAALERATMTGKSMLGGLNIVRSTKSADEIADLINLEVIHQTSMWGEVEDTHDVLHADLRRHLGSSWIIARH